MHLQFFNSPLYQEMIDYIFKTLIPKLQFFYDQFFGPGGIGASMKEKALAVGLMMRLNR